MNESTGRSYAWLFLVFALATSASAQKQRSEIHLKSWNDGDSKHALMKFVQRVTKKGSPDYVEPKDRIAVFDNDGTLWSEQPIYFQLAFGMDRIRAMAPENPSWKTKMPFSAVLRGDIKSALTKEGLFGILMASHAGMTSYEFNATATQWLNTSRHPTKKRLYTELVYQPMLEVLAYLRANGFKTYIVSGGGVDFMRVFAERVYGIPPEQVIGSTIDAKFELRNGKPTIVRKSKINFLNDGPGKPINIMRIIGRRPIAAFGNSDGDLQMLQWTNAGKGARFCAIVHHTDADREWAYDRKSHIGKLDKAMDQATKHGWSLFDMKNDWKTIYPKIQR